MLVDLDGVLRTWPVPVTVIAGVPADAVRAALFEPVLLRQAVTGEITDEAWRAAAATVIHRTCGVDCREALANGAAYPGEVCGDVLAIVRAARQQVPVGLITNATSRLDDHLRQLELSEEVDAVFNSSAMGVAKPDPRIFLQACAQLGAEPTQTVFVDDTAGHVAAACAIGIRGHLFTTADALRPVLREEGILA